ncbi:LPXTG cell wall anchor domain-containing protein [Candidatus Woesearchaeota archaeon]|nr:MAG: LPXTG cell wall anchor domain-containing protein [Candidatus Woesearchaeota archaeon]
MFEEVKKMKKAIVILALAVMMASSAMGALQFTLADSNLNVPKGGSASTTLYAYDDTTGNPVPNVVVDISQYCKEQVAPEYKCNAGDTYSPSEVTVMVTSPTDANGEATVTITHDGSSDAGKYHYTVCDFTGGECEAGAAAVTGDFYIPEFTTIGAGLALIGAGLYAYRKKRN